MATFGDRKGTDATTEQHGHRMMYARTLVRLIEAAEETNDPEIGLKLMEQAAVDLTGELLGKFWIGLIEQGFSVRRPSAQ
ncbi:MAG: hypothetical protein AB7I42_26260 [Bradyrhizobium sp.]|uniref:hypothetical protein n=1 Tax=Bradyrhizobium sp. TaxID=376 RepID=UPI003D0EB1DD